MTALNLLAPGVRLMRQLRMPVKLGLMGLMLLIPLALVVSDGYRSLSTSIGIAQAELAGTRQVGALLALAHQLQAHRGLTHRLLSGDASAKPERQAAAEALRQAVAELDRPELAAALPAAWQALRKDLADLLDGRGPAQRTELFELHTRHIEQVRQIVLRVGENSGLLLDPEAVTYFLMDIAVQRSLPWSEDVATTRGQGAGVLARGDASPVERATLVARAGRIEQSLRDVHLVLEALERAGQPVPAQWEAARQQSQQFLAATRSAFGGEAIQGEAAPYFATGTQAITSAHQLSADVLRRLAELLAGREAQLRQTLWLEMGASLAGCALVVYLALSFYVSFNGSLRALHRGVSAIASGDLANRVELLGRDEVADIGAMLEAMNTRLSAMVAEIRSSAVRVGMSGQTVAEGSQSLAQRTEQQAASLQLTVGTVRDLSAAVAANAHAANELDQLTDRLRTEAEAGGTSMSASVASMAGLEEGSRRVAEIIGVIDGIAFQTNILALNAAVEAARAGEAGRGFAVVAAEVRQLAQRSSAASAEIRQLIARSAEQVQASVRQTRAVGDVLEGLVVGVRRVSTALRSIATDSTRQSADLKQVSDSVGNLDEITRENAGMVERSHGASQELVQRAQSLTTAVASIRLRQGSADEARALVDRALQLVKSRGLTAASAQLHDKEAGFVDRDLYIFVVDRAGTYRLHGAKPAMEGKRVHEVPGIDGERFVRDAWAAAPGAGGWVEYDITNPETGAVMPKASFVVQLDAQQLIGCGVYRQVERPAFAAAT